MRVKSNAESKKLAMAGRGSLVPPFRWDPGYNYHLVFLTDSNGDQIIYQEKIHKLGFSRSQKGNFDTVRCIKGYINETPDPLDPSRPSNTGKCPYCDVSFRVNKTIKAEKDAWDAEHPDATKEEKTEAYREIGSKNPVKMADTERYYLCAHIPTSDKLGKTFIVDEEDGLPEVKLVLVKVSSSQYEDLLSPRLADMAESTGSEVLDYVELKFNYPEKDGKDEKTRKMLSAKALGMSFPVGDPKMVLTKNPGLEDKIRAMVAKLETAPEVDGKPGNPEDAPINHLDEKLFSFIPETELKAESNLAAVNSKYSEDMTDEEKEQLAKDIEANSMKAESVSADDIASKFNFDTDEESSEQTETTETGEAGGFDPEA